MTTPPAPRSRPSSTLVPHDIRFVQAPTCSGRARVRAQVHCEHQHDNIDVETCRARERFVRVDVHEAGYVMLCRSADEEIEDDCEQ